MSHNYFNPIVIGEPVNVATVNDRLEDLDSAISGITSGGTGIDLLNLGSPTLTTLSADSFARVTSRHRLDTEALTATDMLSTITGGNEGDIVYLQSTSTARVINIMHGTGANQIATSSKSPVILNDPDRIFVAMFTNAAWRQIGYFGISYGAEASFTLAGDAITLTGTGVINRNTIVIDTEGGAASDFLSQISGGYDGQIINVRILTGSRTVTVRHNVVNIMLANQMFLTLDRPEKVLKLVWSSVQSRWCEVSGMISMKLATVPGITGDGMAVPVDIPIDMHRGFINGWGVRAAAATWFADGIAAPTTLGTPSASNQNESTFLNLLSGAVAGNQAGFNTATFNLVRRQYDPWVIMVVKTAAAGDIANIRIWAGICGALPTNVDTLVTPFIGFRYSTVAGDAGWIPVMNTGAAQSVGTAMGTITAATKYILSFRVESAFGRIRFCLNFDPQTEQLITPANQPALTDELGLAVELITTAAVAKNFQISRASVRYN